MTGDEKPVGRCRVAGPRRFIFFLYGNIGVACAGSVSQALAAGPALDEPK